MALVIHCCPTLFIYFDVLLSLYYDQYVYINTHLSA